MSHLVIVPNDLRDAINKALDAAIKVQPEAEKDREHLYQQLLEYYDLHGMIPDFTLIMDGQAVRAFKQPL